MIDLFVQYDKDDKTGLDILVDRYMNGIDMCKEMADFIKKR